MPSGWLFSQWCTSSAATHKRMNPEEHEHSSQEGVELPTPTTWPFMCAFGVTLLVTGLVTTLVVTLIGFIIGLIAAVGWFRSVFPTPTHTLYPLAEADRRPAPVKVSKRQIGHLKYGESSHRLRIPVEVHRYSAGILGGLAGGAAMAFWQWFTDWSFSTASGTPSTSWPPQVSRLWQLRTLKLCD